MKAEFQFKFLQYFYKKQPQRGFTIIEILVMTMFIGALAAIALTTLLAQVGKARNAELSITVGTINRAQQQYHFTNRQFTNSLTHLGVTVSQAYQTALPTLRPDPTNLVSATVYTNGSAVENGTRAYAGMIAYNPSSGSYAQIICSSIEPADSLAPGTLTSTASCPDSTIPVQ